MKKEEEEVNQILFADVEREERKKILNELLKNVDNNDSIEILLIHSISKAETIEDISTIIDLLKQHKEGKKSKVYNTTMFVIRVIFILSLLAASAWLFYYLQSITIAAYLLTMAALLIGLKSKDLVTLFETFTKAK